MEFIKELLENRSRVLITATIVLTTGTTLTGTVAFVNDHAVGIAVGSTIRVIPLNQIVQVF
ncbi:MAG TPA: hypothetical protein DDY49_11840 [Paenibacillaceae bacterium]|nr:hypothetical protein [Paenibacillaceae bacterium]